jgi:carboxylesterase type B
MYTIQLLLAIALTGCLGEPLVVDTSNNVTYRGISRAGIEIFLGVPYGQDTGGENRFKPPQVYLPQNGSTVNATKYGPACPQAVGKPPLYPLYLSNVTDISEDCLNLNIARPNGTEPGASLATIVWIHGGSFWSGSNEDIANAPDGMIIQSVDNQLPVIHVAMNYRLGGEHIRYQYAQTDQSKHSALPSLRPSVKKALSMLGSEINDWQLNGCVTISPCLVGTPNGSP